MIDLETIEMVPLVIVLRMASINCETFCIDSLLDCELICVWFSRELMQLVLGALNLEREKVSVLVRSYRLGVLTIFTTGDENSSFSYLGSINDDAYPFRSGRPVISVLYVRLERSLVRRASNRAIVKLPPSRFSIPISFVRQAASRMWEDTPESAYLVLQSRLVGDFEIL